MMEPKFTPGPWEKGTLSDATGQCLVFSGGQIVAIVTRVPSNGKGSVEANASILAAAHDLYSSLTALLNRYVGLVHSGDAGFWDPEAEEEVINSRDAIAKARGEIHSSGGDRHGE